MTKLRCWCREAGKCECKPECFPTLNECTCIEDRNAAISFECDCIMHPASTENAPAYLIGKDERQLDL